MGLGFLNCVDETPVTHTTHDKVGGIFCWCFGAYFAGASAGLAGHCPGSVGVTRALGSYTLDPKPCTLGPQLCMVDLAGSVRLARSGAEGLRHPTPKPSILNPRRSGVSAPPYLVDLRDRGLGPTASTCTLNPEPRP
jgi:hypothetical protein